MMNHAVFDGLSAESTHHQAALPWHGNLPLATPVARRLGEVRSGGPSPRGCPRILSRLCALPAKAVYPDGRLMLCEETLTVVYQAAFVPEHSMMDRWDLDADHVRAFDCLDNASFSESFASSTTMSSEEDVSAEAWTDWGGFDSTGEAPMSIGDVGETLMLSSAAQASVSGHQMTHRNCVNPPTPPSAAATAGSFQQEKLKRLHSDDIAFDSVSGDATQPKFQRTWPGRQYQKYFAAATTATTPTAATATAFHVPSPSMVTLMGQPVNHPAHQGFPAAACRIPSVGSNHGPPRMQGKSGRPDHLAAKTTILSSCKFTSKYSKKRCGHSLSIVTHKRGHLAVSCASKHQWVWCALCCNCNEAIHGLHSDLQQRGCQKAQHWFERDAFDTGVRNHMKVHAQKLEGGRD